MLIFLPSNSLLNRLWCLTHKDRIPVSNQIRTFTGNLLFPQHSAFAFSEWRWEHSWPSMGSAMNVRVSMPCFSKSIKSRRMVISVTPSISFEVFNKATTPVWSSSCRMILYLLSSFYSPLPLNFLQTHFTIIQQFQHYKQRFVNFYFLNSYMLNFWCRN